MQEILSWLNDFSEERLIGSYSCGLPGPLILAVGGIHGNEPNGQRAIREFLAQLNASKPLMSGMVLGLAGNVEASRQNRRFINQDLNRCFTTEKITAANKAPRPQAEDQELLEVANIIHALKFEFEDICFVDCHTTSASSVPYLSSNAHPQSLHLARLFPLYNVVGLEQSIPGCFAEYCNKLDFRGFTFEAGQHLHPDALRNQLAMLWLLLVYSGAMAKDDCAEYASHVNELARSRGRRSRTFRLLTHYRITEGEQFVMNPGFVNFMPVRRHMHLATNRHGDIVSPVDGYMLMPLYQRQGDDGFFLLDEENEEPDALTATATRAQCIAGR